MKGNTRRGFTLIELLVVFMIIAILAAILQPAFKRAQAAARQSEYWSSEAGQKEICEKRLATIVEGKKHMQKELKVPDTVEPTCKQLSGFIDWMTSNQYNHCPAGGNYAVGNMTTLPKCNYVHTINGVVLKHEFRPATKLTSPKAHTAEVWHEP